MTSLEIRVEEGQVAAGVAGECTSAPTTSASGTLAVESLGLTAAEQASARGRCVAPGCAFYFGASSSRWQVVILARPAGAGGGIEDDEASYRTPHRVCVMHSEGEDLPPLSHVLRPSEERGLREDILHDHGWPQVTLRVAARQERREGRA